jgi:hypothetical protein
MDTIKIIEANTELPVVLPWNGKAATFIVRMLNSTQIKACGEFSSIISLSKNEEPTIDEMIEVKNMQERLMKLGLVKPTYNEILDKIADSTLINDIKNQLKLAREDIKKVTDIEQSELLAKEIDSYELYLGFLFPDDFMSGYTAFILQRDNSDIRKITTDMLLEAAVLADKGHDNPSDHIKGEFTDFHKQDIDKHAWLELDRFREEQKIVEGRKTWVRGKRKK